MDEGSLGATVDLQTAHPFDYNRFVLIGQAKANYNDLAEHRRTAVLRAHRQYLRRRQVRRLGLGLLRQARLSRHRRQHCALGPGAGAQDRYDPLWRIALWVRIGSWHALHRDGSDIAEPCASKPTRSCIRAFPAMTTSRTPRPARAPPSRCSGSPTTRICYRSTFCTRTMRRRARSSTSRRRAFPGRATAPIRDLDQRRLHLCPVRRRQPSRRHVRRHVQRRRYARGGPGRQPAHEFQPGDAERATHLELPMEHR